MLYENFQCSIDADLLDKIFLCSDVSGFGAVSAKVSAFCLSMADVESLRVCFSTECVGVVRYPASVSSGGAS